MNTQSDLKFQILLKNIRSLFSFLFQRGYKMTSAMFTDAQNKNWHVLLSGEDYLIKIYFRDEKVHLTLSSVLLFSKVGMFDLHDLVELMDLEEIPAIRTNSSSSIMEQLNTTAWLLEKHMDEILTLFQKIHLGIAISQAGQLFSNSSPAFLVRELTN